MRHRLIHLRPSLNLMEAECSLKKNLSDEHWSIIQDTCAVLEPFMFAQILLQGETYVTISLIPYLIFKIRKGLQLLLDAPENHTTVQVRALARKMMYKFESNWGCGEPDTVATEHIAIGSLQRHKGIPLLALLASLVDPRLRVAAGIAEADINYMWDALLQQMVRIAALEEGQLLTTNALDGDGNVDPEGNAAPNNHGGYNNMFQELNEMYLMANSNNNNNNDADNVNRYSALERAEAELHLYKREPALLLQREEGV
jgi:hypothetical protein